MAGAARAKAAGGSGRAPGAAQTCRANDGSLGTDSHTAGA